MMIVRSKAEGGQGTELSALIFINVHCMAAGDVGLGWRVRRARGGGVSPTVVVAILVHADLGAQKPWL